MRSGPRAKSMHLTAGPAVRGLSINNNPESHPEQSVFFTDCSGCIPLPCHKAKAKIYTQDSFLFFKEKTALRWI